MYFLSSSKEKFTLLLQSSVTDVSAGFRPPCSPTWRFHKNLYKFGENVSPHIFHKNNFCDLNLGKSLCMFTLFLFPDSGLNLLNGFDFFILIYFEWRDTENQQLNPQSIIICLFSLKLLKPKIALEELSRSMKWYTFSEIFATCQKTIL